jgi:hypothetical protein
VNDEQVRAKLERLAQRPIPDSVRGSHRQRIAIAAAGRQRRGVGRLRLIPAAAAVIGFTVGSTGLAMAGALPDPAQNVAHDVLGTMRVDVPAGKQAKRGPCVAEAAKIEDEAAKQTAKDACPKGPPPKPGRPAGSSGDGSGPGKSGDAPGHGGGKPSGRQGNGQHQGDPCKGRPPWAGRMTQEERVAAQAAASRADCPPDIDDDEAQSSEEQDVSASEATAPIVSSDVPSSGTDEASSEAVVDESSVLGSSDASSATADGS